MAEPLELVQDDEIGFECLDAGFGEFFLASLGERLQRLTGLERQKIVDEYETTLKLIEKLKGILASATLQLKIVIDELEARDMLDCLQLLHFHLGSQVSSIIPIKNAMQEASNLYVELAKLGVKVPQLRVLRQIDVVMKASGSTSAISSAMPAAIAAVAASGFSTNSLTGKVSCIARHCA